MARHFHNPTPSGVTPPGADDAAVKKEFAKRLQARMVAKHWSQSDFARAVAKRTSDGTFGKDNISNYIRGKSIPTPANLKLLAEALDCAPDDLLPNRGIPSVENRNPGIQVRDAGNDMAWVTVNQATSWEKAISIQTILRGS